MNSIKLRSRYRLLMLESFTLLILKTSILICFGIMLKSLGWSHSGLWSDRKGDKSCIDLNAPPNQTLCHVRGCSVKWCLDTFLYSSPLWHGTYPQANSFCHPDLSQYCRAHAGANAALIFCQGGRRILAMKNCRAAWLRFCAVGAEGWMAELLLQAVSQRGDG